MNQMAMQGTKRMLKIGILEGDDIGHEVVPASVRIARAAAEEAGVAIEWIDVPIGRRALETHGHTMPEGTLDTLGGLVFLLAGHIPKRGECVTHPSGWRLEAVDSDPRRILRVRLHAPETEEKA